MGDTVSAINEFVELAILRKRGQLPVDERWRLDALEDVLRDSIDGAHPAPRRIEGPAPSMAPGAAVDIEPAKVVVRKSPAGAAPADAPREVEIAPAPPVELSADDQSKVKEVAKGALPPSGYTATQTPCYLEDYYTADLSVLSETPAGPVSAIVSAGGENVQLLQEARVLLGVAPGAPTQTDEIQPIPLDAVAPLPVEPVPSAPAPVMAAPVADPVAAMPPPPPAPGGMAIVHMLVGGFQRGELMAFDPAGGIVVIKAPRQPAGLQIALSEVLAIFFSPPRGAPPLPIGVGQRLTVKLANDRELLGASPDYAPGVQAMTLIPDDRRGNVDRIWVPAWAVKEIHFA